MTANPNPPQIKIPLAIGGRSLIAPLPSRVSCHHVARVMVLSAVDVSRRKIWSGPKRGCCKVHNGFALTAHPRPLSSDS